MTRNVDLVSYLPPFLAEFREMSAALEAENPEFRLVWDAADRVLKNEFIATADEYGISRFESLLGIYPSKNDTLEERRARVQIRWFNELPYTWRRFLQRMASIFTEEPFTAKKYFTEEYRVWIGVEFKDRRKINEIRYLYETMFPANIIYIISDVIRWALDHTGIESLRLASVSIHVRLPFWHAVFLNGAYLLDGTEYLDSRIEYYIRPRIEINGTEFHEPGKFGGGDLTVTRNLIYLNGDFLLDGSIIMNSIYRKEAL